MEKEVKTSCQKKKRRESHPKSPPHLKSHTYTGNVFYDMYHHIQHDLMYLCMLLLCVKIVKQHGDRSKEKWKLSWLRIFFSSVSLLRDKKRKETRLVEDRDYYVNIYWSAHRVRGRKGREGRSPLWTERGKRTGTVRHRRRFCSVYEYVQYKYKHK